MHATCERIEKCPWNYYIVNILNVDIKKSPNFVEIHLGCCSAAPAEILSPLGPTAISVNETYSVSLTCAARGFPAVDFTWWYQSTTQLMDSDPGFSIQSMTVESNDGFLDTTSTLTIPSPDRADAGNYSCVASNTVFGSPVQDLQQFMLTVNCKCLIAMHAVYTADSFQRAFLVSHMHVHKNRYTSVGSYVLSLYSL